MLTAAEMTSIAFALSLGSARSALKMVARCLAVCPRLTDQSQSLQSVRYDILSSEPLVRLDKGAFVSWLASITDEHEDETRVATKAEILIGCREIRSRVCSRVVDVRILQCSCCTRTRLPAARSTLRGGNQRRDANLSFSSSTSAASVSRIGVSLISVANEVISSSVSARQRESHASRQQRGQATLAASWSTASHSPGGSGDKPKNQPQKGSHLCPH